MVEEFDLIVRNAKIVDGTGAPAFTGSVGVRDGRVAAIGAVAADAKRIIDASGRLVTPGFIDAHSHADLMLNWYPRCENYVMQGVTTWVGGLCGDSPAPLGDWLYIPFLYVPLQQHFHEFFDYKYYPTDTIPMTKINAWMKQKYSWEITWKTMGEWLKEVLRMGITANYVPFVGHCTIRQAVLGEEAKRPASESEIREMEEHVARAMEEGCFGLSTGIDYDPGTYATREEVERCVAAIKPYGGVYSTHWRRTGRRRDWAYGHVPANPIQGIVDELNTAKKVGVPIQISHLSAGYIASPPPPRSVQGAIAQATVDVIDGYIADGVDAWFDVIPFSPNWDAMPYLSGLLEPWLREFGGREGLGKRLAIPEYRKEIKDALWAGKWWIRGAYNPVTNFYWGQSVKVVSSKSLNVSGKTVEQVAKERGVDPLDAYFDLIAEDPDARGALRAETTLTDEFEKTVFRHKRSMVGIDTFVYDDKYQQTTPPYHLPGANTFGAYPSFLKRSVEENKSLTLEEAILRTTSNPAAAHMIPKRGALKVGNYADINIIDWQNFRSLGDEVEPRRYPTGVEYVIINGAVVVDGGKLTEARPGRILSLKD